MKRLWGRHGWAGWSLVAGAAALVMVPSCVHDDSTLFIHEVLAQPFGGGQACTFTPTLMSTYQSSGVLDIAVMDHYDAEFLVENQMVSESNPNQLQTETSDITLQGGVVRITNAAGEQLKTFTRLGAGPVAPAQSVTGFFLTILDSGTVTDPKNSEIQSLANLVVGTGGSVRLVTYTRLFGVTSGGKSVESNEFEYPIDLCNGCRVVFTNVSPGADGGSAGVPNCIPGTSSSSSTTLPTPCYPGWDNQYVDCAAVCLGIPLCRLNSGL